MDVRLPDKEALAELFEMKYRVPETAAWSPRLRW